MANTRQSVIKHVLTEGDRIVVGKISPLGDQGGYAIAINYGTPPHSVYICADCKLIGRLSDSQDHIPTPGRNSPTPLLPFSQFYPNKTSPHIHPPYFLTSPLIPPSLLTARITNHPPTPPSREISTNNSSIYVGSIFNVLHSPYELEWDSRGFPCVFRFPPTNCSTGEMDDWIEWGFC